MLHDPQRGDAFNNQVNTGHDREVHQRKEESAQVVSDVSCRESNELKVIRQGQGKICRRCIEHKAKNRVSWDDSKSCDGHELSEKISCVCGQFYFKQW